MKLLFTLLFFLPLLCLAQTETVTITSVTPTTLCPGARLSVSYSSTGNFSGGATLYLMGPGIIGTNYVLGSTNSTALSGTILGIIPDNFGVISEYTVQVRRIPSNSSAISSSPSAFTVYGASPPTVINPPQYCQSELAVSIPLASFVTATGALKWYTAQTYGTLLSESPVVSTSANGGFSYFVSQTINGCESLRSPIGWSVNNCSLVNGYDTGGGTGLLNTFLGTRTGKSNTTGSSNTFVGNQAGYKNTIANANVFIGSQAGFNNTTGGNNLFLGSQAGANSNGSYNLFMGNAAGGLNTTGEGNTAIGDGSFLNNMTGNNNTAIGRYAGINNIGGTLNTFIGVGASNTSGSANLTNATAIGYNAFVSASNAMVLGNNSVNVGIGNSAPNNKLEITKGAANQSGLRFTNLTSASPATLLNQSKFLAVNENGDVVMASVNSTAREGVAETLWQRKGLFLQNTQNEAVVIGANVSRTPSGYKLFVEDGILTEKVKVAVKNTSEWSDYVFDKGYTLKSLSEVEQYIQTHAHLPGIPSATEVVEKGIDVAKMDATLLEKIEELTLYSIEQDKKLEVQQKIIKQQQVQIDELKALMKQVLEKK